MMKEDNRQPASRLVIVIAVIIVIAFIAAAIWFATLNPGESVMVMCVIFFVYFGFKFLFG